MTPSSCFPASTLRTFRGALAIALLLAAALLGGPAQTPGVRARTPVPSAASLYRIAGRVVNANTGEPVSRATVTALNEGDGHVAQSVQSDADGRFAMESLPAGKYPLTASRRGFRTAFYDEHDEFNSAIVTGPDQDTSHLVFRLMPGAVIYGVVTADGGDPVENASVLLFQHQRGSAHGEASDQIKQVDATTADDTGAYEFGNLAPGEYLVAVATSPWYAMHPASASPQRNAADQSSPLDVAYPVTFYDSTTDEASASPILLTAGAREQADINLHAVPALRLQVAAQRKGADIVQPELRQMIFGVQVSSESASGVDPLHTGVVEFYGVAPGRYELMQGDPPRIVELDAATSQDVDPSAGVFAVSVTGVLRTASGAALPDNLNLMLEPVDGRGGAILQADARKAQFRFDIVPPGVWSLSATPRGESSLPVVSIATGGNTTGGNQITVKDRSFSIVATVSQSLSKVQGIARKSDQGAAGVMIVLVPRQPSAYRALVRFDQSDSDGSFALQDVPAGQYTVVAIEDGWTLDRTDRDAIARYLPGGAAVTVSGPAGTIVRLSAPVPVQPR